MSLQRRLVAVMSILLVVGLLVADVVTYVSVRSFLYGRADDTLASSEALAFNYVAYNTERKTPLSPADLSRHVSPDVYVLIIDHAGKVVISRPSGSPTKPDPRPLLSASVPVQDSPDITSREFGRYGGTFRPNPNAVIVGSARDPDGRYRVVAVSVPQGTMYIALSLNPTNDTLASLRRVEGLATVAVLAIMVGLALWLIRRGLRPLRKMAETADAIASGDLTRRVPEEKPTSEVGRLGHRPQRDAHPDRGGLRREVRLRGAPAPVRGRRLPRAPHALDVDPGVRRTAAPGRVLRRGGHQ